MNNREKVISRVQKEMIGPGSDLFECSDKIGFTDEIIADKPLSRYYSAILYPKKKSADDLVDEDDEGEEIEIIDEIITNDENGIDNENRKEPSDDDKEVRFSASTFFPSQYGISFVVSSECKEINVKLSFGTYDKAKAEDIAINYGGDSIELLGQYGLSELVEYNEENEILKLKKELNSEDKKILSSLRNEHQNSILYKTLKKLFFKDKYRRHNNTIETVISISDIMKKDNQHYKVLLSEIPNVDSSLWWKDKNQKISLKDNLWLHIKLYKQPEGKSVLKIFINNTLMLPSKDYSIATEILNQTCLFQTEIKVETPFLIPFNDYKQNINQSDEDRMLDFLYRKKLSYGIGHNTACIWENHEDDTQKPKWISSTFSPHYNVNSQSTDIPSVKKEWLDIKGLSEFSKNEEDIIISNLKNLSSAYLDWIEEEKIAVSELNDQEIELGNQNIEKCRIIESRMHKGIELLENNPNALRAFKLANTAIYLQMFQNQWHFSGKKDGFDAYEREKEELQYSYEDYGINDYPDANRIPIWRPFQLAFILQCLPSFIEEDSADRDLVDLLYFPTGGGKTEAYLALSAFLIFWRRLEYPDTYGGVNIIIRYTLRLLSAQQFERATKLILASEFIRRNHNDLGAEKITIGFWVGDPVIPNKIEDAIKKLDIAEKRLNSGQNTINPFQLSNCQWCNTKIIGKLTSDTQISHIGHRKNRHGKLTSYCLNEKCIFSRQNGELPIVLVDDDIYENPPTVLFGTVDKFAQLAWKEEATSLFNSQNNRKPELIIQDELHLLNGPLGSLVGLFENVIISLCTEGNTKPKIISSTATVKNVDEQVKGLYSRSVQIFPQNVTNADDTFFSKTLEESKRRYVGILPTGKTQTTTSLRLNAALLFARLEVWRDSPNQLDADQFWTIMSYFKSLKQIGRFSNKITSELMPEIIHLQVRNLMDNGNNSFNYSNLPFKTLELTSRIPSEKIKKNLDKLDIPFDGQLIYNQQAYDIVLATNMISVGLDVGRLGIMLMNGMPPNTAEYIQASSRVARKNEGIVFSLLDPNNSRDLSYFEDFVPFHKTFYKQVEPISVTPFAENALEKVLFTTMVTYFRHKLGYPSNNTASALNIGNNKKNLLNAFNELFVNHQFADKEDRELISDLISELCDLWDNKIQGAENLFYNIIETNHQKSLLKSIQDRKNLEDKLVATRSLRSVEPNANINIKSY